jgi:GcrA cell cycle regulator
MTRPESWLAADNECLIALWRQGHTTAQIGLDMNRTKNAIVGRAHRLVARGLLDPRPSPIRWDESGGPRAPRIPPAPRQTLPALSSVASLPLMSPLIVNLARPVVPARFDATPRPEVVTRAAKPCGHVMPCCWPIGEPRASGFRFCKHPSEPGRPYCEEHVKIAYVRVRYRREDVAA